MRPAGVSSIGMFEGSWWVAHTKARQEKALAGSLRDLGVGYYLPMLLHETFSGGRKRKQWRPLFASYVFFVGGEAERYQTMCTHRVAAVLPVLDQAQFKSEVLALEAAIDSGQTLRLYPQMEVGQRCRVTAGPMQGYEGTVLQLGRMSRVVLFISMLGRGAELEIHRDHLEVVTE